MTTTRNVADSGVRDDIVLPFRTEASRIRGRLVRLGPVVNEILTGHDYPQTVAEQMGQAIALTALLGTGLKFDGKLILQTKSDGPLGFFVTNFQTPGQLRGYADFDAVGVADFAAGASQKTADLLGQGHLALTIDQGEDMDRYQGIVPLDGASLSAAAQLYFRQSEQLPTHIRLTVARQQLPGRNGEVQWRAGGLLVQHVSPDGGKPTPEDAPDDFLVGDDDDDWLRVRLLAETVEDHELIDPTLSAERLLYRLFHEEGVRAYDTISLEKHCPCSREHIAGVLSTFGAAERADMKEESGQISVTCEFCRKAFAFTEDDLDAQDTSSPSAP
ncbi:MAG: Hsp33 family molecular chaperone [Pseudomonadota bacterium]